MTHKRIRSYCLCPNTLEIHGSVQYRQAAEDKRTAVGTRATASMIPHEEGLGSKSSVKNA